MITGSKMKKMKRIIAMIAVVLYIIGLFCISVYANSAADNEKTLKQTKEEAGDKLDSLAVLISGIFQKIGVFVIFIGGIQVAWAMSSDNPEMKGQAIKLIAAGILVTVMSTAYPVLAG